MTGPRHQGEPESLVTVSRNEIRKLAVLIVQKKIVDPSPVHPWS